MLLGYASLALTVLALGSARGAEAPAVVDLLARISPHYDLGAAIQLSIEPLPVPSDRPP